MESSDVLCADAFDALADLDSDSAHAAVVDYPWEFIKESGSSGSNKFGSDGVGGEFRGYNTEAKGRLRDVLSDLGRVITDGGWMFLFSDDTLYPEFRNMVEQSGLTYRKTVMWAFGEFSLGYYFRGQHIPIIAATNGETSRHVRDRGTVIQVPRGGWSRGVDGEGRPTGKPVELYRRLLAPPVIRDGERLLEPFCGHGPGAAVAAERGIEYWGCDVDTEAVERARDHFRQQRLPGVAD